MPTGHQIPDVHRAPCLGWLRPGSTSPRRPSPCTWRCTSTGPLFSSTAWRKTFQRPTGTSSGVCFAEQPLLRKLVKLSKEGLMKDEEQLNNTVIGEDVVTVFYYSQADPMMILKGRQALVVTELQAEPEIITGGVGSRRWRQNWRRGCSRTRRRSRSSEMRRAMSKKRGGWKLFNDWT